MANRFDILEQTDSKTALSRSFLSSVNDSALDINFGIIADFPKISAFCVRRNDGDFDGGCISSRPDGMVGQ